MMSIILEQHTSAPTIDVIDSVDNWIIVSSNKTKKNFSYKEKIISRYKQISQDEKCGIPVSIDLPNKHSSHVSFTMLSSSNTSFDLLSLSRKLISLHSESRPKEIGVFVAGFSKKESERIIEAIISAILAVCAKMPNFKSKKQSKIPLSKIILCGFKANHRFRKSFAIAEGNALTRSLSMMPSNKLTPTHYLKKIKEIAKENKWKLEFYSESTLRQKKAGAFLAVSQGSPTADSGIVRLRYKPKRASMTKKIFLVGKGICYDTGGTNLKPANYMFGMHEDMQGSAVALGTLLALTKLNYNRPVECWMALAMNHIGPKAYKPNDIVTASDGTTIEVVHTDAEGRMVLADTLVLASKEKPSLIIDYATLTGACMYSIGTSYSGIFTNVNKWHPNLIKAGEDSGERVWPFPLDEDFDQMIKSDIADIKQCSQESVVDHILASRFLQRFVKNDVPWIHMDLSSSNRKGGLGHIPTNTTGFGVRYTVDLLLKNYLK